MAPLRPTPSPWDRLLVGTDRQLRVSLPMALRLGISEDETDGGC
jgi:hypothetical protein